MRNGIGAVVVLAAAFCVIASSASAHRLEAERPSATCDGASVKHHVHRAHALLRKTYEDHLNLPVTDLVPKAQRHKLCVRIGNVRDDLATYRDQRKQAWYENVNPYTGGGQRWALPYYVVVCESGAGSGSSNYYGLLQGWDEWNYGLVQTADAGSAPKLHQDMAAHRGWTFHGGSPWTCA